jgi:hypothetical protein
VFGKHPLDLFWVVFISRKIKVFFAKHGLKKIQKKIKKVFLHVVYGQISQKIKKLYFLPKNICYVCVFAFILDIIISLLNS